MTFGIMPCGDGSLRSIHISDTSAKGHDVSKKRKQIAHPLTPRENPSGSFSLTPPPHNDTTHPLPWVTSSPTPKGTDVDQVMNS